MTHDFRRGSHCIYLLTYRVIFITKYIKKCLTPEILDFLRELFADPCKKWEAELVEFGGESDHVHLLVSLNIKTQPSKFVNNLKSVSSRKVRK